MSIHKTDGQMAYEEDHIRSKRTGRPNWCNKGRLYRKSWNDLPIPWKYGSCWNAYGEKFWGVTGRDYDWIGKGEMKWSS